MSPTAAPKRLKMVVCYNGAIDDAFKIFGFFPSDDPQFFNMKQFCNDCHRESCHSHETAYALLKGSGDGKGKAPLERKSSIFLVFFYDWNIGDLWESVDARNDVFNKTVCGYYATKEAALATLQLPVTSELPDHNNEVESPIQPPSVVVGEPDVINGQYYCREYPVIGW